MDDEDHRKLDLVTKDYVRTIKHQGHLSKFSTSDNETEKLVGVWLFEDLLLYARPVPGTGKYQLLRWLPLRDCMVCGA